ncbi:hypothetical protein [Arthrobacter sp. UYEF20]|uniref:hypothetical protein n=1 Tax=Arthrobacter sp. UYEF20 TaxID=1756363 RepID=UPI003399BF7C
MRIIAALMVNRCPAARPAQRRPTTIGAAQARQMAPIAAIHHAMAPAGPVAAATAWAVALAATAVPTMPAGTRAAGRRTESRRVCGSMVLLAARRWDKDFTPSL